MQPCPQCGGSGGYETGPVGPVHTPPQVPLSRGRRLRIQLTNLLVLAVLGGYVYYTTR